MFTNPKFVSSVYRIEDLPKNNLPEIILCGRSNVGKSSFINSFFNRKKLALVSATPGKTRSINYYSVNNSFYFVDLPGFGYAKASKSEQKQWAGLITQFLNKTENAALLLHFIDCRYPPTQLDEEFYDFAASLKIQYAGILTKIDKISRNELSRAIGAVEKKLPGLTGYESLFPYSAKTKSGTELLRKLFRSILEN